MIGVTGHRDLVADEVPLLDQAVETFLADLGRRFPDLPLLVTTPLAEGADRLVARVAQRLGIEVNILLPMPLEHYEQDFEGVSAETFEEMLALGDVIELPLLGDSVEITHGPARDAQYEYLGVYLAAHSHILLALWDGKPSEAPGGTAQVIRFHQENVVNLIAGVEPRSAIDFSEDESDLAYHIVCSRRDSGPPEQPWRPGEASWLTRDDVAPRTSELPARYVNVFDRQAQMNRDLARFEPAESRVEEAFPVDPGRATIARDIASLFVAVDHVAVRYQRVALRALRGIYLLAALTGLSFIAYADFPDQDRVIWLYLLFLGLGFFIYLLERRGAWYRRYLDYRALAEGLRVQCYWALAGVQTGDATEFPHDRFMRRQELELGWIRNVMRYAGRRTDAMTSPVSDQQLEAVIEHWIGEGNSGQTHYYRTRVQRLVKNNRLTTLMGMTGFAVGLASAVVLALYQARLDEWTVATLIAVMVGLPYLAAVRASYAERISEHELIAQFAHYDRIFSNALHVLSASVDVRTRRSVLRAVGEEEFQEVGQWLMRQRERPVSGERIFHTG